MLVFIRLCCLKVISRSYGLNCKQLPRIFNCKSKIISSNYLKRGVLLISISTLGFLFFLNLGIYISEGVMLQKFLQNRSSKQRFLMMSADLGLKLQKQRTERSVYHHNRRNSCALALWTSYRVFWQIQCRSSEFHRSRWPQQLQLVTQNDFQRGEFCTVYIQGTQQGNKDKSCLQLLNQLPLSTWGQQPLDSV